MRHPRNQGGIVFAGSGGGDTLGSTEQRSQDKARLSALPRCGELVPQVGRGSEVHLVGSVASEGGMWHVGVVCLDEESDQLPDAADAVGGVEVEPLVLEGASPCLDDGVGEGHLDLGKDTVEGGPREGWRRRRR